MKRSIKLTLIVLLLAVTVFVAVSCGKKNVDEILINDDGMPQLVYVLGCRRQAFPLNEFTFAPALQETPFPPRNI